MHTIMIFISSDQNCQSQNNKCAILEVVFVASALDDIRLKVVSRSLPRRYRHFSKINMAAALNPSCCII